MFVDPNVHTAQVHLTRVAKFKIDGEEFYTEEDLEPVLGPKSSQRSNASRRQGPPRIVKGHLILYRGSALREWLIAHEIDYDAVRDAAREGGAKRSPG